MGIGSWGVSVKKGVIRRINKEVARSSSLEHARTQRDHAPGLLRDTWPLQSSLHTKEKEFPHCSFRLEVTVADQRSFTRLAARSLAAVGKMQVKER